MTQNKEDISLKILRMLYHNNKQNPSSGVNEEALEEKFEFLDRKEGKVKVKNALSELIDLNLVHKIKDSNPLQYAITEQGIIHYEKFKFFADDTSRAFPGVNVEGDWYGHTYHNVVHNNVVGRGSAMHFPGKTEEFMNHYKELTTLIEEAENLVLDAPKGKKILEILDQVKAIIKMDSSSLGNNSQHDNLLKEVVSLLKDKVK